MNKIPNYRVWHKIEKRFVDLRSIDFEQESIGYDAYREANYYDVAKFDEIVFQQWTGLKDKNGKEIFEGDRVRFSDNEIAEIPTEGLAEVIWCTDLTLVSAPAFGLWYYEPKSGFSPFMLGDIEVVGNIFQLPCNPDHNGECLICDCWLSDCPFNKDKTQDDLQKLVKEDPMWQKPL